MQKNIRLIIGKKMGVKNAQVIPGYLFIAIVCFAIGCYFLANFESNAYVLKASDFRLVEHLIIAQKPEFKETTGKRGRKWIEFKCENNRNTFEIAGDGYSCCSKYEILEELHIGDTVSVRILKDDSELLGEETACEIHTLASKNKQYLNPDCRNAKDQEHAKHWYLMCFTVTFMTGGVYSFRKKPKFFDYVDPRLPIWIVVIVLFFYFFSSLK